MTEQFLTTDEAAEALQVSPRTIARLIANGTLPAVRIGRIVRIDRVALGELINAATAARVSTKRQARK